MGTTWGPPGSYRPQMGPMLAPWTLLSWMTSTRRIIPLLMHWSYLSLTLSHWYDPVWYHQDVQWSATHICPSLGAWYGVQPTHDPLGHCQDEGLPGGPRDAARLDVSHRQGLPELPGPAAHMAAEHGGQTQWGRFQTKLFMLWKITLRLFDKLCEYCNMAFIEPIHHTVNSLAPGRLNLHFRWVIFMLILVIDDWCISCKIAIGWRKCHWKYSKYRSINYVWK